jgi:hypothetical protein
MLCRAGGGGGRWRATDPIRPLRLTPPLSNVAYRPNPLISRTVIPAGTYSGQSTNVRTIGIDLSHCSNSSPDSPSSWLALVLGQRARPVALGRECFQCVLTGIRSLSDIARQVDRNLDGPSVAESDARSLSQACHRFNRDAGGIGWIQNSGKWDVKRATVGRERGVRSGRISLSLAADGCRQPARVPTSVHDS